MKPAKVYSPYTGLLMLLAIGVLVIGGGALISFIVIKSLIIVWSHF